MKLTLTSINNWYHIAVTYDGTTRKLYFNGALEKAEVPVRTPTVTGTNLLIGTRVGGGYNFQGLLDEAAIYNWALSGPATNCTDDPNNEICERYNAY